jgi:hypothetical protein
MNTWMVPKNKRTLTHIPFTLPIFLEVANEGEGWKGNRINQRKFEEMMENSENKGKGNPRDKNSGGARTYRAQYVALGLIFLDTSINPPVYRPTWAGEMILNSENPIEILQYQLLKLQYPSVYSVTQGVNINPEFKIRPFLFVCKLLLDPEIGYITKSEFGRFVIVYGKTENDFDHVKKLILAYREDPDNYVLPETFMQDSSGVATTSKHDLNTRIGFLEDKANIFFNYLDSTHLCARPTSLDRLEIDKHAIEIITDFISENRPLLNYTGKYTRNTIDIADESFQRHYGLDNTHSKDNRRFGQQTVRNNKTIENRVMWAYYTSDIVIFDITEEVINYIHDKTGVRKEEINNILDNKHPETLTYFETNLIELGRSGKKDAIKFEKKIESVFKSVFGYKTKHIGQVRPKYRKGGNIDIIVISDSAKYCGIIDTKSYSSSYSLPNDHIHRLVQDYIPHINEHSEGNPLSFFMYVSDSFSAGFNSNVRDVKNISGVSGCGITVHTLIRLIQKVNKSKVSHEQLRDLFSRNGVITIADIDNIEYGTEELQYEKKDDESSLDSWL